MEEYAHLKNVENFERELQVEQDPQRRTTLEKLLVDEKARLARVREAKRHPTVPRPG